jgi:hypothetical protein
MKQAELSCQWHIIMSETIASNMSAPVSTPEKYTFVEFDAADDRWDPKNFSKIKKWIVLAVVTHGAVIVTCASSLYVSFD